MPKTKTLVLPFPPKLQTFHQKYRSFSYAKFLQTLEKYQTDHLACQAQALFHEMSKLVKSRKRFVVFVENWIPTFKGKAYGRYHRSCVTVLENMTLDAWKNFLGCEEIQTEENLYRLFQLVTLNFILRKRLNNNLD